MNESQQKQLKAMIDDLSSDRISKDIIDYATLDTEEKFRKFVGDFLLKCLINCKLGNRKKDKYPAYLFQKICFHIISITFAKEFPTVKPKSQPHKAVYLGRTKTIRDIILTNRYSNSFSGNLWNDIKSNPLKCQIIVFECKNHDYNNKNGKIKGDEILQLYHYLNPNNMGKFGVIICRDIKKTLHDSALQAINRIKQDNYVVLLLDDDLLGRWIDDWVKEDSPETFFSTLYQEYNVGASEIPTYSGSESPEADDLVNGDKNILY